MQSRRTRLGLAMALLALPALGWAGQDAPTTFEQAKAEAKAHDKLLLLDFFTET